MNTCNSGMEVWSARMEVWNPEWKLKSRMEFWNGNGRPFSATVPCISFYALCLFCGSRLHSQAVRACLPLQQLSSLWSASPIGLRWLAVVRKPVHLDEHVAPLLLREVARGPGRFNTSYKSAYDRTGWTPYTECTSSPLPCRWDETTLGAFTVRWPNP